MSLPIALQIYSVRTDAERDTEGTFKALRGMGYEGAEFAGLYGKTAKEFAALVAKSGLEPVSAHVGIAEMRADINKVIKDYTEIGCRHIAVPWLGEEDRPGGANWAQTVADIRRFGEILRDNGITLSYHNHDFEFARDENGEYHLDVLYKTVPADILKVELDTCWARVGGVDPAEYLLKYSGRCPLVHLKDYVGEKSRNMYALIGVDENEKKEHKAFEYRSVGDGVQDFKKICSAAEKAGAEWFIIEQDEPTPGKARLECAEASINYLKSIL